jgi:2'-5' RNA ligase
LRLFVGTFIELPERKSIELFQESNVGLQLESGATINWSPAAKLHITWCFLGDVDDNKVSLVKEGVDGALQELKLRRGEESSPKSLLFTRMAFWPKAKFPHIIVLRPDRTDKYFAELANLVRTKTQPFLKVAGEQKEFRAHITLARVQNRRSSESLDGIADDTAKGSSEGIPQDSSEGIPQDSSEGIPQDSSEGIPQDSSKGIPQDSSKGIPQDSSEDKRCSEKARLSELKFRGQEQLFPLEVKINRIELIESSQKVAGGYRPIENFELI